MFTASPDFQLLLTMARGHCKMKILLIILSMIGFVIQVTQVSRQYFKYTTTTVVTFVRPHTVKNHPVAVCIRYSDILDKDALFKETGIRMRPLAWLQDAIEDEDKLTIRQVMDYTPAAEHVIDSCFYRPDRWLLTTGSGRECHKRFNVSKFYTGELICYKIEEMRDIPIDTAGVTKATFKTLLVFEVEFTPVFTQSRVAYVIMFLGTVPYKSRENIAFIPPLKVPGSNQSIYNTLYATPADTRVKLLPAPYDTNCTKIDSEVKFTCKKSCLIQKYKLLNRAPTFELLTLRHDLKPLTTKDLMNQTIKQQADKYLNECVHQCDFTPCLIEFSHTTVLPHLRPRIGFSVASVIAFLPDTHTRAQAKMSFIDYFSFICTCIGAWFGISFLTLDPSRWLGKRKQNTRVSARPA
jgi:hypothetical protein